MLSVLQAHVAGKNIQFRFLIPISERDQLSWVDLHNADHPFNFASAEYRIKPEPPKPREWWIRLNSDGVIIPSDTNLADNQGYFDRLDVFKYNSQIVHVREVLPE